jgi:hypothetical protein
MAEWTKPRARDFMTRIRLKEGRQVVGDVEWFYDGGPYYPHTHNRRFGAFGDLDAAKRAVERYALKLASG